MKKQIINSILSAVGILLATSASAYRLPVEGKKVGSAKSGGMAKSANCLPASASITMDFNDVSALIEQGGSMFQDRQNSVAAYEVPKGSGLRVIYSGALWMGGKDVNGQLKLAALTFRNRGNDFWPGPLTITPGTGNFNPLQPVGSDVVMGFGDANISPEVCAAYDRFYTIKKAEVEQFSTWWECNNGLGAPGCSDEVIAPSSELMNRLNNWPAHGDVSMNQAYYLAPFYDRDQDGVYSVDAGDYPWYDDILGRDDVKCGVDRRITLFGDATYWWVFNDKGNIHGETQGDPIGMEIRAQAFAFATNDEINRMTFYNYEMINRGTQTLYETYFSQYMDPDIGNSNDDYVGCDVSRGLGFAYNGNDNDVTTSGQNGYGVNPPAVGVDFFEGPYQDDDNRDNIGPHWRNPSGGIVLGDRDPSDVFYTPTVAEALADKGIVYKGIGIGYSDSIIDNERFGMRRFTYYTNTGSPSHPQGDPSVALEFYNYMQGKWRYGAEMYYGEKGVSGSVEADYMFPGDSDPLNWGTGGVNAGGPWSEETASNNPAGDRRFVQSAGPFTLRPGAVNNITVGVVYGRGSSGRLSSVQAMKAADTKAQALFDACFEILDPPSAPRLQIQELNNQLVLTLDNPVSSNNYKELYEAEDKINIVDPSVDRKYRFQGYQIYQLVDEDATVADVRDPNKARLVAQCDIKDSIKGQMLNYIFDEELGASIPTEMVDGANEGIRHSFLLTEDAFATGDNKLVNFKTYYYVAVAYAYNQFKEYDPEDINKLDGQKLPYISSRLGFDGGAISIVSGVPHNPSPEADGTVQRISYGSTPRITRIDGTGNGNRALTLTKESHEAIVANGELDEVQYDYGAGPIDVKVIDPLNVKGGYYECKFVDYTATDRNSADTASWVIYRYASKGSTTILDSVHSSVTVKVNNEQLIPKWGVSVTIQQHKYELPEAYAKLLAGTAPNPWTPVGDYDVDGAENTTNLISTSISFADSSKPWLTGVVDNDVASVDNPRIAMNWIASGTLDESGPPPNPYNDYRYLDNEKVFSKIFGGIIAPHKITRIDTLDYLPFAYYEWGGTNAKKVGYKASISFLPSVDIVLTSDKSKWTRVPVIELGRDPDVNFGNAKPGELRKSPSVDKEGNPDGSGTGMSWFPGYAIDIETGVRLYMAIGENSSLIANNGRDMIWNPTSTLINNVDKPILGGQHSVMIWGCNAKEINNLGTSWQGYNYPAYIPSQAENLATHRLYQDYLNINSSSTKRGLYPNLAWIANLLLEEDQTLLSTDVTIKLRVNKEYKNYVVTNKNDGRPMYGWSMDDVSTLKNDKEELTSALDLINVVPNPYYAYSQYERTRLETKVKITNLPERCTVKIFSVNGKLVRTFKKDNPLTYIDWDLNNSKGIGVAGGVYLIHVDVPGVGEKIVKFFGGMRAIDLQGI